MLVIEADEWVSTLLSKYLGEAGYEVHLASEARRGFEMARKLEPDCIVCDAVLPDVDGFWVAKRIRTEPSRVATTPFLFLTGADNDESRLMGLNVGADVYMTKPFRNEEVVAQVAALIDMANRLRLQRDSFMEGPSSSRERPAFRGELAFMSVATMLTMLEMERRVGSLKVRSEAGRKASFEVVDGAISGADLDGRNGPVLQVLREVLGWQRGRFSFRAHEIAAPSGKKLKINGLLLEAMRLRDESNR